MSHEVLIDKNSDGTPRLRITVEGSNDVYRIAFAMLHFQVEFMEDGARIMHGLRKEIGKERFTALDQSLGNGHGAEYAKARR